MIREFESPIINLDVYESLEFFANNEKNYNHEILKANLAPKLHCVKVEFLRYFIV